jgi:predicted nucleic acid-binding protein
MTVCLDTNVLVRIFGTRQPFRPILRALLDGRLTLAVSTEILLGIRRGDNGALGP